MTRLPLRALALCALAAPALAQEGQPAPESEETRPTNQTSQFTTEGMAEDHAEGAGQPEDAMGEGAWSQGGTGALVNAEGAQLGNVSVSATPSGHALVVIQAEGFAQGVFAVHLHRVGLCEGPGFESAGEHIGGQDEHGVMADTGPHAGDLPNAHVQEDGVLGMEAFAIGLSMDEVFDEDGSALVVHESPDDYTTQPSGNAGARIACAVIEAAPDTGGDGSAEEAAPEGEAGSGG